ncbi:MAG: hypothetical protein V1663_02375 [archaeon]
MELASCYSRCKDIGIRSIGILIVSDNRSSSILNKKELLYKTKFKILKIIIDNIESLNMSNLKVEREFNIDKHLASVIEDPENSKNVYKEK